MDAEWSDQLVDPVRITCIVVNFVLSLGLWIPRHRSTGQLLADIAMGLMGSLAFGAVTVWPPKYGYPGSIIGITVGHAIVLGLYTWRRQAK